MVIGQSLKTTKSMRILLPCIVILLSIFLIGCGKFDYKSTTDFTIDETALSNKDLVNIIYWSGAPDHNRDNDGNPEYYCQYIVVSQSSGDTVRVLSPEVLNEYISLEGTKTFISQFLGDKADKLLLSLCYNANTATSNLNKSFDLPVLEKVISNPEFQDIETMPLKTTIGLLHATVSNSLDEAKSQLPDEFDKIFNKIDQ